MGQPVQAVETASTKTLVARLRSWESKKASGRRIVGEAERADSAGLVDRIRPLAFFEYGGSYWRIFSSSLIAADRC